MATFENHPLKFLTCRAPLLSIFRDIYLLPLLVCYISLATNYVPLFFSFYLQGNELKLADMFFNPEKLHEPGMIDDLIRGMSTTSMETLDQFITDEVTSTVLPDAKMLKMANFSPK